MTRRARKQEEETVAHIAAYLRAGDRILLGQGCAQPPLLARALLAACEARPVELFIGPLFDDTFTHHAPAAMRFAGYAAMGRAAELAAAERLAIHPVHYGTLETAFAMGKMRADIVLLLAGERDGRLCAAFANDYVLAAARHARHVIIEVNRHVPWCPGAEIEPDLPITARIDSDTPLVTLPAAPVGRAEAAIAGHVAELIPDGATLQTGIGAIPDAVLTRLTGHRDLGLHSGVIGEGFVTLMRSGAVTHARKSLDPGIGITNTAFGDAPLREWLAGDPALRFMPARYTHACGVIARQDRMVAINSVLEIDLSGQVNAERIGGRRVGGTGGLAEFSRGAMAAQGGMAILTLRATDRSGSRSRIVPRVDAVTLARADTDIVVTEYGVARLRGRDERARAQALIAIAHPDHRDSLERAWREIDA